MPIQCIALIYVLASKITISINSLLTMQCNSTTVSQYVFVSLNSVAIFHMFLESVFIVVCYC